MAHLQDIISSVTTCMSLDLTGDHCKTRTSPAWRPVKQFSQERSSTADIPRMTGDVPNRQGVVEKACFRDSCVRKETSLLASHMRRNKTSEVTGHVPQGECRTFMHPCDPRQSRNCDVSRDVRIFSKINKRWIPRELQHDLHRAGLEEVDADLKRKSYVSTSKHSRLPNFIQTARTYLDPDHTASASTP